MLSSVCLNKVSEEAGFFCVWKIVHFVNWVMCVLLTSYDVADRLKGYLEIKRLQKTSRNLLHTVMGAQLEM